MVALAFKPQAAPYVDDLEVIPTAPVYFRRGPSPADLVRDRIPHLRLAQFEPLPPEQRMPDRSHSKAERNAAAERIKALPHVRWLSEAAAAVSGRSEAHTSGRNSLFGQALRCVVVAFDPGERCGFAIYVLGRLEAAGVLPFGESAYPGALRVVDVLRWALLRARALGLYVVACVEKDHPDKDKKGGRRWDTGSNINGVAKHIEDEWNRLGEAAKRIYKVNTSRWASGVFPSAGKGSGLGRLRREIRQPLERELSRAIVRWSLEEADRLSDLGIEPPANLEAIEALEVAAEDADAAAAISIGYYAIAAADTARCIFENQRAFALYAPPETSLTVDSRTRRVKLDIAAVCTA